MVHPMNEVEETLVVRRLRRESQVRYTSALSVHTAAIYLALLDQVQRLQNYLSSEIQHIPPTGSLH